MNKTLSIQRREFLRLGLLAGCLGLVGCTKTSSKPILGGIKGSFPSEFLKELPSWWNVELIKAQSANNPYPNEFLRRIDLLIMDDGWLNQLSIDQIQEVSLKEFSPRLNNYQLRSFLANFEKEWATRIFPIAASPWIILFRNGRSWIEEAQKSWSVLLNPELKGKVIFPSSPHLLISLADHIGVGDDLNALRNQARAFDDRNGLNWLLSGEGSALVIPLKSCLRSIAKDPRLTAVLPKEGSPLNWTLLSRPVATREPFPKDWINNLWEPTSLHKFLMRGFITPSSSSEISDALNKIPTQYQSLFLPLKESWERSWSLPYLNSVDREKLSKRWNQPTKI